MPPGEMPAGEMPASEMPASEIPASEMAASEMPASEMPAGKAARNNDPGDWRADHPLIVMAGGGPPSTPSLDAAVKVMDGETAPRAIGRFVHLCASPDMGDTWWCGGSPRLRALT